MALLLIPQSSRLAYYILFLVFPFQTQTDEEDRAQSIIEGLDFSDSRASSGDEKHAESDKAAGAGTLVTTSPVLTTNSKGHGMV